MTDLREIRGADLQLRVRNLLRHLATYDTDSHFVHSLIPSDREEVLSVLGALEDEIDEKEE